MEGKYDIENLNYWAARLKPLWINPEEDGEDVSEFNGEETLVIVCNRRGKENGKIIRFPFGINIIIRCPV